MDRLGIDQRAFLSIGDHRFLEGVWSGTVSLERHLDSTRALTANEAQRARAARLPATVRQVLDSVALSYDIKDARGARAALAFFDAHESVIAATRSQAEELKTWIVRDTFDQILNAHGSSGWLKAMLDGVPSGVRFARVSSAKPMVAAPR